jgi:hypothetical protein
MATTVHPLLDKTQVAALIPAGQTIETLKKVPYDAKVGDAIAMLNAAHITHLPVTGSVEGKTLLLRLCMRLRNFANSCEFFFFFCSAHFVHSVPQRSCEVSCSTLGA